MDGAQGESARKTLAKNFRALWRRVGDYDYLEEVVRDIHTLRPWREGWIAVKGALAYDGKSFEPEILKQIQSLEAFLKPSNLLEKARVFAFSDQRRGLDLDDIYFDEDETAPDFGKAFAIAKELGKQVAQAEETFLEILPELVSVNGRRLISFGEGLAEGAQNRALMWKNLVEQLQKTEPDKRQIEALMGFIWACRKLDRDFYNIAMDAMIEDDIFSEHFPSFQIPPLDDQRGVARLKDSLAFGRASAETYRQLAYGRAHDSINDDDLAEILDEIMKLPNGNSVVIAVLSMRFHGCSEFTPSATLVAVAAKALLAVDFSDRASGSRNDGYDLAQIVSKFLTSPEYKEVAVALCQRLSEAMSDAFSMVHEYGYYISSLAPVCPDEFLDIFLEGDDIKHYMLSNIFSDDHGHRQTPLKKIDDDRLIAWCERDPQTRYPALSNVIATYEFAEGSDKPKWRPIAYRILSKGAYIEGVLNNLAYSIHPKSGWTGSLADILERRISLFEEFYDHEDSMISSWARQTYVNYTTEIRQRKELEENRSRDAYESFE